METTINNVAQKKSDIYRKELLSDLPVKEQFLTIDGISTTYLEGGKGTPLVLLHGPGEPAVWWMRVIPGLVKNTGSLYQIFRAMVHPDHPVKNLAGITGWFGLTNFLIRLATRPLYLSDMSWEEHLQHVMQVNMAIK